MDRPCLDCAALAACPFTVYCPRLDDTGPGYRTVDDARRGADSLYSVDPEEK